MQLANTKNEKEGNQGTLSINHKEGFKNLFNTGSRELCLVFLARVRREAILLSCEKMLTSHAKCVARKLKQTVVFCLSA